LRRRADGSSSDGCRAIRPAARRAQRRRSGRPVWIRTDAQNGHGMQMSLSSEAAEFADLYTFLEAQLP
jgi:prolyl oligopeptidase